MKKIKTLFAITIIFLLIACGENDGSEEVIVEESITNNNIEEISTKFNNRYIAIVKFNNKDWFVDDKGNMLFGRGFEFASFFNEGLAIVKENGVCGYINPEGTYIINTQFTSASSFNEGLAPVEENNLWGYIDLKGNVVIKPIFSSVGPFKDGIAVVKLVRKKNPVHTALLLPATYGFINKEGKFIIEDKFYSASPFSNGVAKVTKADYKGNNQKTYYINLKGEIVDNVQEANLNNPIKQYSEGLTITSTTILGGRTRFGLKDSEGNEIADYVFDKVGDFVNGVAPVQMAGYNPGQVDSKTGAPIYITGLWGYLDVKGKWLVEPKFEKASNFYCINECEIHENKMTTSEEKIIDKPELNNEDNSVKEELIKNVIYYQINDPDGYSNLRDAPKGEILQKVIEGEQFEVIGEESGYKKVKLSNGTTGYIHKSRVVVVN